MAMFRMGCCTTTILALKLNRTQICIQMRTLSYVQKSLNNQIRPLYTTYEQLCRNHRLLTQTILSPVTCRCYSRVRTYDTVDDVANFIKDSPQCNIAVMVGAGISTLSGIPDFRDPTTGLYHNLQKYDLPYAEAIFDIDYFKIKPEPFFKLASELYPSGKIRPNLVHYFVRLLHEKKLLLRMYTQNIDGLERVCGIPDGKLIEAHGTFSKATCRDCHKKYNGKDIEEYIVAGLIPRCSGSGCNGIIKPDIVFFGENLPSDFFRFHEDMPNADLLIVLGTSLQVYPFANICESVPPDVPRILFNREVVGQWGIRQNDITAQGELLDTIQDFAEKLGWWSELEQLMTDSEKEYVHSTL